MFVPCAFCKKPFRTYPCYLGKRIHCSVKCSTASGIHSRSVATHGQSRTKLHEMWCNMKGRCKRAAGYADRGIRVCNKWSSSFVAFRDWALETGYKEGLEIDRRDVNGNYSPDNCRWATRVQQMRNTRKRKDAKTSKFKGVSYCPNAGKKNPWRAQLCFPGRSPHIGMFATELAAARAYDAKAVLLFGKFANLNFPRKEGASF